MTEAAALLARFLRARDTPCPRCGYNLRDLAGSTCPECGDGLALQVGLVEPRLAAYVTLLSAVCMGFGASAFLALVALSQAAGTWFRSFSGSLTLSQTASGALLLALVLAKRRRFRRWSSRVQWLLALGAWCLVLAGASAIITWFEG